MNSLSFELKQFQFQAQTPKPVFYNLWEFSNLDLIDLKLFFLVLI